MKSVDPKIYDEEYYLNVCLGSEEFRKSNGKIIHDRWKNHLKNLKIAKDARILDVGCGRGDIALYLARKAKLTIGIDYSKDAISLANKIKKKFNSSIKKKTQFRVMNIKKLNFPNDFFDVVICIDVLEHLHKKEVEKSLGEISRVLKKDGVLFVHTGPNKILYNITYKWYIFPMNKVLTKIDQLIKRKKYSSFPKDPRIPIEKEQHVNEPTYFYLRTIFKKYNFEGTIRIEIGYLKPIKNFRTYVYNILTTLYPLSKLYPFNTLFGWAFIAYLKNKKF